MLAILGIFGKKEKFYAQVDDDNTSSTPDVASATVTETKTVTEIVTEETSAPVKPVATKGKQSAKTASAPTQPVVSKRLVAPEPFWVKAMENTRNYAKSNASGSEMTFSTDYLLPKSSNSRRRPGPSLNTFLGMARQIGGRGSI